MAATASPDTIDPPARLRSILEHRRAAGLAWSDVVFDRVVDEITRPLKPTVAEGWREVLLSDSVRTWWRQAYAGSGPGRHALTIFL